MPLALHVIKRYLACRKTSPIRGQDAKENTQMSSRTKAVFTYLVPIAVLCVVNLGTFFLHYSGKMSFPWDFVAGYHANSYGWYSAGSIFDPPGWLPWADMGFPAFLALQSGAWYLPLAFLDAIGIDYTIHVATAFQSFHVLVGAIGAYFLLRRFGFCAWTALLGALAYHFTAAFYSGQQFVDIVRAAAILPWLWLAFHPDFIMRSKIAPVITSALLWQFLVAAYPGNIVSTAYGSMAFCLIAVAGLKNRRDRILYLSLIGAAVIAALMMAMIKWYPIISQRAQLSYEPINKYVLEWKLLAAVLLPYDVDFFPGDLAMRSLWLPLSMLWGISFVKLRTSAEMLGAALVALTFFMAMAVPSFSLLMGLLPGMQASRFLVSDWRPIFQLGMIFLAVSGWKRVLASEYGQAAVLTRGTIAVVVTFALLAAASKLGYPSADLLGTVVMIAVMALVGNWVGLLALNRITMEKARAWVVCLLCLLVVGEAALFQFQQAKTWRAPWNPAIEAIFYGDTVSGFIGSQIADPHAVRRPTRYVLSADPDDALESKRSLAYNRCWYSHTYCVFGYNNLKMSIPHRNFSNALAGEGGRDLLAFARRPQQLLVLSPGDPGLVHGLTKENHGSNAIGQDLKGVSVDFSSYLSDEVIYRITVPRSVLIVENEIWWSGWSVNYCNEAGCSSPIAAKQTPQGLRSWALDKGSWNVVLKYNDTYSRTSYKLFALGLLLSVLLPFLIFRISRLGSVQHEAGVGRL